MMLTPRASMSVPEEPRGSLRTTPTTMTISLSKYINLNTRKVKLQCRKLPRVNFTRSLWKSPSRPSSGSTSLWQATSRSSATGKHSPAKWFGQRVTSGRLHRPSIPIFHFSSTSTWSYTRMTSPSIGKVVSTELLTCSCSQTWRDKLDLKMSSLSNWRTSGISFVSSSIWFIQ